MPDEIATQPAADALQQAVIEAPAASRLHVIAGPGAGKTFTLLRRAEWLIDHGGLDHDQLLILSFSRAAVENVVARGAAKTELGRLRVQTVDSLASRLLVDTGVEAEQMSFDRRIKTALEVLAEDRETLVGEEIRHVLVDEAQDVVGIRAAFVAAVLARVTKEPGAGFTVFGDPAQAIYDFQFEDGAPEIRLLSLVGEQPLACDRHTLDVNYRMTNTRLTEFAEDVGAELRSPLGKAATRLRRAAAQHIEFDAGWTTPEDAAGEVAAAVSGPGNPSVALLTRGNAEALRLGTELLAEGVDVCVQHRAIDRGAGPWLAWLFAEAETTHTRVPDSLPTPPSPWLEPPGDLLRTLRHAGLVRRDEIDLIRLADALRMGAIPESLVARRSAAVTASTIHRSKGLEFDTVFVVESRIPDEEDASEEARVLYVAATRAKDELLHAPRLKWDGYPTGTNDSGRVTIRAGKGNPRQVEVRVSDFDADWAPSGQDEFDHLQRVLVEGIRPGDAMELRREATDGEARAYDLVHLGDQEETIVGRTGRAFAEFLERHVRGAPPKITGIVAEIPDTAAMSLPTAERVGRLPHGLHLRARAFGLGRLDWHG